jgi:site-specific DNA recombinase
VPLADEVCLTSLPLCVERVERLLQSTRRKARPKDQSLLLGLLYDADGNRFTPAHAHKGSRRYRYYISQAVLKGKAKQTGPTRLPAREIEALVIDRIRHLLQSPQRLAEIAVERMGSSEALPRLVDAAAKLTGRIDEAIASIVERVIVHRDRVKIKVQRSGLCRELFGEDAPQEQASDDPTTVDLVVEVSLKRHGGEMRLQLPHFEGGKSRPIQPLVRAIARANDWFDRILKGELRNGREISRATGFDERYVSRILPLAFLSPDLTEAILDGSLCPQLRECPADISLAWAAQRGQLAAD